MISLGTLTVAVMVLEAVLRLGHLESDNFLEQDAVLAYRHRSNFTGRWITKEFNTVKHLNNHGAADNDDYAYEKPAGAYRIVLLGDSSTEGFQVKDEATWAQLLEDRLNEVSTKHHVQVINLGVTSYSTSKEAYVFEKVGQMYEPDLVVLGFWIGNDIYDIPNQAINVDAHYRATQEFFNGLKRFLRNHSAVMRFLHEKRSRNAILAALPNPETTSPNDPSIMQPMDIYEPIYSTPTESAIAKNEQCIKKIDDMAKKIGARFVVLLIPERPQVHLQLRPPHSERLNFRKPNTVLVNYLRQEGIAGIDLLPAFEKWTTMNPNRFAFFPLDGHNNESGHKIIADNLFDYLIGHDYGF